MYVSSPSSRMLQLLSLLQARRDWPGGTLAERLDVSARTIRRDVDRLRELGYVIAAIKGPDGGYRLEAGSELPPLLFDDEQAVALAIALQGSAATGVDVAEGAQRALATVRQVLPSHLRHRVDSIALTPDTPDASEHVPPAVIEQVSAAVHASKELRFSYGGDDSELRRAEPHGLVRRGGRWYLVAWELERERWRLFRLDRMALRTHLGPRFSPRPIPTGDAENFVDARFKGSEHENVWPCTAVFDIDAPISDVLPWIGDGRAEVVDERSTRVTIGSWSWMGALAAIVRFDVSFRIVGPPELVVSAATLGTRLGEAVPEHPQLRTRTSPTNYLTRDSPKSP